MGLFEHWPYTNFHDLNLDWIIKEIPKVYASRDEAQESAEASAESAAASQLSADAALASQKASRQSELNAEESETNAAESEANAKNYADNIADPVAGIVTGWLDDHVTPTSPIVDNTLTIQGAAADAKATGDKIEELQTEIININTLNKNLLNNAVWSEGAINFTTGADSYSSAMIRTDYVPIESYEKINISIDPGYKYVCALINEDKTAVINTASWTTVNTEIDIADFPNAAYVRFLLQKIDNTKPDNENYINVITSTELLEAIDKSAKYGEITYKSLASELQAAFELKYNETPESVTYSETNKLLRNNGTLLSYTGNNAVSDYIDCSSWTSFLFKGRQWYEGQCLAFYDSLKNFISCYPNETSGIHDYADVIIMVPSTAKYIRLATFTANQTIINLSDEVIPASTLMKWNDKKWCCIGDSLTEVNSTASKRYHDYINEKTGINVVNLGIGGTGYMNGGTSGTSQFYNRVSSIPLDSDVITIFGSFNDLGATRPLGTASDTGTNTIGGCINKTLDDIFTLMPLANIGIVTPTPWGSGMYPLNANTSGLAYVNLIIEICTMRGIPYLDLFHNSQLRPWDPAFISVAYTNDPTGVHPDENGQKLIAPRFEGFLDTLLLD